MTTNLGPAVITWSRVLCPALLLLLACCKTDEPKSVTPPAASDAGSAPPAAAVVDAGAPPPSTAADAGQLDAAASAPPSSSAPLSTRVSDDGTPSMYDRVLAKPRDKTQSPDELKALVEKKLGVKITTARKSAGKWVLFQLAPAKGGRDAAEQKRIVDALKAMSEFENAEADRLMKVK